MSEDLHDETMKRIEAMMAASEARDERIDEEKRDPCQELKESVRDLQKALVRFALIIMTSQFITMLLIVLKWLEKK